MSLTILSRKLDKLNDKEKLLKLTYDVRGTNKHQHRYIKDLKEDFKDDLQLRFGTKPFGLGWNQESEADSEKPNEEEIEAEEIIEDDEGDLHEENADMMSPETAFSNFRPGSGKVVSFTPQNRPFSASTVRPGTAGSVGGGGNVPKFLFSTRPISAIAKVGRNFQSNTQDISESTLMMSMKGPQSMYQVQPQEVEEMQESGEVEKVKGSESIFWKNTKKYDNAQSAKQFQTKNLLFNSSHSNPKLISSKDLVFLKEEKVHNVFEKSKMKDPANHEFREVALRKKDVKGDRGEASYFGGEGETQLDAKNSFNQSLSYIQTLRTDLKGNTPVLSEFGSVNKRTKPQRPVTAHPLISAVSPSNSQKVQLEIVAEQVQENHKVYFSSLSDLRKKAFFLRLHSMEPVKLNQPGLNKELKLLDWTMFKELSIQPDFQSIHLMLIDLNTFDHARYELEFQEDGGLKAKDKEDLRNIIDVQREFRESNRTNIAAMTIYVETTSNRLLDVFSRVLVQEKQDNEYDLMVWRNIYRYLLYKIILANSPLYPYCKTYQDLSRMIKDIIDDKKDYVSPVSSQIQQTKDQPIVVERNGHVYNFDFHSYILECSSYYAQSIGKAPQKFTGDISNRKKETKPENARQRPVSAMDQKNKFPMFGQNKQTPQNAQKDSSRKGSSHITDPAAYMSHQNPVSQQALSTARHDVSGLDRPSILAGYSSEHLVKMERPSLQNSDRKIVTSRSLRNIKKTHENIDMTLQGGRMDIYQDIRAASTVKSTMHLRDQSDMMSMSYGDNMHKFFSSSAYQTPKDPERLFQMNPNGITVQYNKSPMKKKKNNVIIKSRPQSGKAPIRPHNMSMGHSIGMATGNNVRSETSFRFKF